VRLPSLLEIAQIFGLRGRRSRNKVSVGEPAFGSLKKKEIFSFSKEKEIKKRFK